MRRTRSGPRNVRGSCAVWLVAAALAIAAPAWGVEVTLCGSDTQPGPGTNFAQALVAGGTITFRCAPSVLRITQQHFLTTSVDIDGGNRIILDGDHRASMLLVTAPQVQVRLANITVRRVGMPRRPPLLNYIFAGVVEGQDVLRVSIYNSRIVDSYSPIRAGDGSVTVSDTVFDMNHDVAVQAANISLTRTTIQYTQGAPIIGVGGQVSLIDTQIFGNGRSVFDQCTLSIIRTPFTNNIATADGPVGAKGGGAVFTGCTTEIVNSNFTNNRSTNGGAIYVGKNAPHVTIRGSRFDGNIATVHGGAIAMEPLMGTERLLALQYVVLTGNRANLGGAVDLGEFIENNTALEAQGVTFSENTATARGGAVAGTNAAVRIARGVFVRNEAAVSGAAIALTRFAARTNIIANTLFVLNKSPGGTFVGDSTRLVNSTVLGSQGPGLKVFTTGPPSSPAAVIRLANTIVENNSGGNCTGGPTRFVNEGSNLQYPDTSCGTDIPVAAALLDGLYAPILGGPARAQGTDTVCASAPVQGRDVYGLRRPQADRCSIGAVEGDLAQLLRERRRREREPRPEWPLRKPDATTPSAR
jgi:predicted outer membrane repeat protein